MKLSLAHLLAVPPPPVGASGDNGIDFEQLPRVAELAAVKDG